MVLTKMGRNEGRQQLAGPVQEVRRGEFNDEARPDRHEELAASFEHIKLGPFGIDLDEVRSG